MSSERAAQHAATRTAQALEAFPQESVDSTAGWTVLLPLKQLSAAKSRLAPLPPGLRASLALAMAVDTAEAALGCPAVAAVRVNCNDERAAAALAEVGCVVVADHHEGELNTGLAVLASQVRAVEPGAALAALTADLPALRPGDLTQALAAAGRHPRAYVSDAGGSGTTLLTARSWEPLRPAYGPGSSQRHRRSGAAPLRDISVRARRDVDTLNDLRDVAELGVGRHTMAWLSSTRWLLGAEKPAGGPWLGQAPVRPVPC